jgi:hypothetical protein
MAAAPEDADLSLNLVFESAPAPPRKAASAPSKKRKNKYDRRREKGRLAKLANEDKIVEPKKEHDANATHRGSSALVISKENACTDAADDDDNIHRTEMAYDRVKAESQNGTLGNINDKKYINSFSDMKSGGDATNNATITDPSIEKAAVISSAAAAIQTTSSRRTRVRVITYEFCIDTIGLELLLQLLIALFFKFNLGSTNFIRRGGKSSLSFRISRSSS